MGLPEHVEPRAAIKFCVKLGYNASKTYEEVRKANFTPEIKRSAVYKWHKRFKEGRQSLEDDERSGRPAIIDVKLVTSVKNTVEQDRRLTIREIVETTGASYGTVRTILQDNLNMRRLCARWVPRILKDDERQRRVLESRKFVRRVARDPTFLDKIITCDETWLCLYDPEDKTQSKQWTAKGDQPPTKALATRSGKRFMFIMFADIRGMLLCHAVPSSKTVNSEYYSKVKYHIYYFVISCFILKIPNSYLLQNKCI
jgi:transposase